MPIDEERYIDIINFGVSFLATELINQVPINPFRCEPNVYEEEYKFADDIWISYWLKKKRVMPFKLLEHYDWLHENNKIALSKQPQHMGMRNQVVNKLFKERYYE